MNAELKELTTTSMSNTGFAMAQKHPSGTRRSIYFTAKRLRRFQTAFNLLVKWDLLPKGAKPEKNLSFTVDTAMQYLIRTLKEHPEQPIEIAELTTRGRKTSPDDESGDKTRRILVFTENRANLFTAAFRLLIEKGLLPQDADFESYEGYRAILIDTALDNLIRELEEEPSKE
jgi:hypothetical protein